MGPVIGRAKTFQKLYIDITLVLASRGSNEFKNRLYEAIKENPSNKLAHYIALKNVSIKLG